MAGQHDPNSERGILMDAVLVLADRARAIADEALECQQKQPCQHCFEAVKRAGEVAEVIIKLKGWANV